VKYADDLVLVAKEETVHWGMTDGLTEIGICCGVETNVEKAKIMTISRELSPLQVVIETTGENGIFQPCG
jgi:hypothetical protein